METVETTNETETINEISADGRTVTETVTETRETPVVDLEPIISRLDALERRLTETETEGGPRMAEGGATETIVEQPAPDKADKGETKAAEAKEAPPAEGDKPAKKKRHAGFFF